jgi:hypothetical protein
MESKKVPSFYRWESIPEILQLLKAKRKWMHLDLNNTTDL